MPTASPSSPRRTAGLGLRPGPALLAALALSALVAPRAVGAIDGSVIDRGGQRKEVRDLQVRGSTTLEYYVDGKRRRLEMARIERFEIGGNRQDQEAPVTVVLRTGRVETGTIVIDAGASPHADVVAGGATVSDRLTGKTDLGPLFLSLGDVQAVLFTHAPGTPIVDDVVDATIIDERGRRFEVSNLRFRNDDDFRYSQGRKKRRIALRHLARLEFGEVGGSESRPVTMTYKDGTVVPGEVEIGTVRLSGETDNAYATRVDSAFTGRQGSGTYAIGLRDVKLVLFKVDEPDADEVGPTEANPAETDDSGADAEAVPLREGQAE